MTRHASLAAEFDSRGIDRSAPGFYDDPAFMVQEKRDSHYLERYAHYVASLPLDAEYITRARREIPFIARIVHDELVADGRLGACVDIGMMLSRILERERLWNCQIKGSLTIDFPKTSGLPKQYFWSVDVQGGFTAAHSWLVAPPFSVVDVALKQQPYRHGREHMPALVLTESRESVEPAVERIVCPEIRTEFRRRFGASQYEDVLVQQMAAAWLRNRTALPSVVVTQDNVRLVYDSVAVGAPDTPFQQSDGWSVHGRTGFQLYTDLIVPALQELRQTPTSNDG